MLPSQRDFLRHIENECAFILRTCKGKSKEELIDDEILRRAIVRSIEIIGEAAKKLDDDFRSQHPEIEWKKIAGTRDIMIHHYFGIDYDIVWDIITNKIPELQELLEELIGNQ
jgi:uncharacterized protein with HEPN domain